jgi:hypothetical protein
MDPAHSVRPVRAGTNTSSAALLARTYVPAEGGNPHPPVHGSSTQPNNTVSDSSSPSASRLTQHRAFPLCSLACHCSRRPTPFSRLREPMAVSRRSTSVPCPRLPPRQIRYPSLSLKKKGTRLSLFSLTRPALLSSHRARRGAGRRVGVARPGRSPADRRGEAGGSECFALV